MMDRLATFSAFCIPLLLACGSGAGAADNGGGGGTDGGTDGATVNASAVDPNPQNALSPGQTVLVKGANDVSAVSTPTGSGCVALPGGQCVKPQEKCGENARADVVLGPDGKAIDIVCYPATRTPTLVDKGQGAVATSPKLKGNNQSVVLDANDDGADIVGGIRMDGNNAVLYGQSADRSLVQGTVEMDGNNAIVRGTRIQGDLRIHGNGAVLLYLVVEGNVFVDGNNVRLIGCTVFGKVTLKGNNAEVVGNRIGDSLSVDGKEEECRDNRKFADGNRNKVVEPAEVGEPIDCRR